MVPRVRAIVDSLAGERARLERFARSLTEEELRRAVPGSSWRVKDFIAHLSTLDAAYIGWYATLAGDPDPGGHRGSPGFDVDRFNESAVAERRDRSVNDLLDEAVQLRGRLVGVVKRFSDDMLKALPERRHDPELVAWLGRPDVASSISSYQKAMG